MVANGTKANGKSNGKANGNKMDVSSSDESSSESESESEEEKAKTNGKAKGKAAAPAPAKKAAESSSDDSSDDESSSESDSDSESSDNKKKRKAPEPKKAVEAKKASSSSGSDSSSDDSSSDDSSSDSDDSSSATSEEEEISKPVAKKQKTSEETFAVTAKEPFRAAAGAAPNAKIFIKNLPFSIEEHELREFFSECGEVAHIKWIESKDTGRFTGGALVTFASVDAAEKAVAKSGAEVKGRPCAIEMSRPQERKEGFNNREGGFNNRQGGFNNREGGFNKREGGFGNRDGGFKERVSDRVNKPQTPKPAGCKTVFVGNLSFDINDELMGKFLADCGEVAEIRWIEKEGQFKGCGFVEFTDSAATDKAVAKAGTKFLGRDIRIDYAPEKRARN